jgi:hypothetical protein
VRERQMNGKGVGGVRGIRMDEERIVEPAVSHQGVMTAPYGTVQA